MKKILLILPYLFIFQPSLFSQVRYKVSEESTMTISGTSTIHDWTSTVNEINGEYVFKDVVAKNNMPASGSIADQIKIVVPVLSIESPRGTTMDNKTYNALKSEEYPNITFQIKKDEIVQASDKGNNTFSLAVTGDLTLAGFTKTISLKVEGKRLPDGSLSFKGSYPIDMMEYNIEPPTAMFGQIKTGKDITIDFDLILMKE